MSKERISIQRNLLEYFDSSTFMLMASLILVGVVSIYSATHNSGSMSSFYKQAMYAALGLVGMFGIMFTPVRILRTATWPLYGVSIVLVLIAVVAGHEVAGARSWIRFAGLSFQPSELAKLGTLFALARYITRPGVDLRTWRDLGFSALILALPAMLVLQEPDFGSATVFVIMWLGVVLWSGADLFLLFALATPPIAALASFFGDTVFYIIIGVVAIAALGFRRNIGLVLIVVALNVGAGFSSQYVYDNVLRPHQQDRITAFLDPHTDPRGTGYHVIQSGIAVGSGGLLGKGFLQGTQTQLRYIPEQRTDFIFCVPTEEFGFAGGTLVIGLLTLLVLRAYKLASNVKSRFLSIVSVGVGTIWMYHMLVNIGMAIGLMPVMGIPLPFLSAGGTALMVNMMMVGLLLNVFRNSVDSSRKIF